MYYKTLDAILARFLPQLLAGGAGQPQPALPLEHHQPHRRQRQGVRPVQPQALPPPHPTTSERRQHHRPLGD